MRDRGQSVLGPLPGGNLDEGKGGGRGDEGVEGRKIWRGAMERREKASV